jgi:hypothetical protein
MRPYQDSLSTGGGTTPITHIGTVVLSVETINGSYREIPVSNCLYSPSVPLNLLSLSLLREKGLFFSQDMQWLSTARTPHFIRLQLYQPDKEIYSLYDYRKRYATYRTDLDLLGSHQNFPWIPVWDDHEVSDNTYRDGASELNNTEASFIEDGGVSVDQRKMNAVRAYFEWSESKYSIF